tara:strand:- start:194 stop:745 length:552 start_codon:yes stop_codon:yes gene_type:complete
MNPLTLFSGPYALLARFAVLGLACAALFGYGWFKGNEHGTAKLTEYIGKQLTESIKMQGKQAVVTEKVVKKYIDRVKVIKEKGDEIEKLVTVFVPAKVDAGCRINNGYLRLHNAAATNTVPEATHPADEAASGLKLSHTLRVIAGNYSTCHQTAARLVGLQSWVSQQYELSTGQPLKWSETME